MLWRDLRLEQEQPSPTDAAPTPPSCPDPAKKEIPG